MSEQEAIEMLDSFYEMDEMYISAQMGIKALKKQINGGWIPCSEKLPEEAFPCLVTVLDTNPMTMEDFNNILPYFVGYDGESWNDGDGEVIPFEVIAWQPLPAPYKPMQEGCTE